MLEDERNDVQVDKIGAGKFWRVFVEPEK